MDPVIILGNGNMSGVIGKDEVTQHISERSDLSESPRGQATKGKGDRVKAHIKKFWWLHLIIFIIITLVIVLPL